MSHGITKNDSMFSVRETPWHGLGAVLKSYPKSIKEALEKSGLGWTVKDGQVAVARNGKFEVLDQYKANIRTDTGDVLGIVSQDYRVVQNQEAFRFMDALIGSDLHFETAGSLANGKRVWVLARLPEFVELGGDQSATYVYVANSHDGSMAVTAATTPVRIVCANTLGMALRKSEVNAERVFKFRHTGDLQIKYDEARKVIGLVVNYEKQFKKLADQMSRKKITQAAFEKKVLRHLYVCPEDMGPRAQRNREQTIESILDIWNGKGSDGDTIGNSPGSKWVAWNAICEHQDFGRRYTARTDQMQRSFEDTAVKQRALDLVLAA